MDWNRRDINDSKQLGWRIWTTRLAADFHRRVEEGHLRVTVLKQCLQVQRELEEEWRLLIFGSC